MQIPTYEPDIKGETWLGGPTHHLQRQHIPKYGGHVHGLIAENVFGRPFAKITGDCLNDRVENGFIIDEKKRLQTMYGTSFVADERDKPKEVLKKTADSIIMGMSMRHEELKK